MKEKRGNHTAFALLYRHSVWLIPTLALSLGGCAADQPKPSVGRTEAVAKPVETGGFTVKEATDIDSSVRADFDAALKFLAAEDYQKGIDLLTKVTERAKGDSVPYIDLAIANEKIGNLKAAEDNLKKALDINPLHPVANNEYGLLYRRTGRFAEARAIYEKTLNRYPSFLPARKNLAILCDLYLRDYQCALKHYQIYQQAVPDDKTVKIWITEAQQRSGH